MEASAIILAVEDLKKTWTYRSTKDVRLLSAKMFRSLPAQTKEHVFKLSEELLRQRDWAMGIVALDFAYRVRSQYQETDFPRFTEWLLNYVHSWSDCDDFCTHAFGALLCQYPKLASNVLEWCSHEAFWMRRGAAVVLIPMIQKQLYDRNLLFAVADQLLVDSHDLVLKGYGWMLKVLSQSEPQPVIDYLAIKKGTMPRISFRYAIEKLDPAVKQQLMKR